MSKLDEIKDNTQSDDDRLITVISAWTRGEGKPVSWRQLLDVLDWVEETTTADSLNGFAEPVEGKAACLCSMPLYVYFIKVAGKQILI